MARLYPFQAHRYNPQRVGDISLVVTQPYDKISDSLREEYLKRHPQNIVRVIKNENYVEAGRFLNDWIEQGALTQDPDAAFYVYRQEFSFEGQTLSRIGFIGLIDLADPGLAIKGHENILDKPLEDRLNLIRATEANEGLIFTLFSDPGLKADRRLETFADENSPDFDFVDETGVKHQLWTAAGPSFQQQLISDLEPQTLYIADGHHRFQTSALFHRECLERGWRPAGVESFDKRMIAVFNMESPGLKILPTHRGVRNLRNFSAEGLLNGLKANFTIQRRENADDLAAAMRTTPGGIGLALNEDAGCWLLQVDKAGADRGSFMPEIRGSARGLDVNVLHEGILKPLLGIGQEELARQSFVDYFREKDELLAELSEGRYQAAFLLNATTLQQVREISELGEKMPQKSTDFYPKLLTGLALMKMKIEK
jgi:uncharacterized protein (DUF1015 family)